MRASSCRCILHSSVQFGFKISSSRVCRRGGRARDFSNYAVHVMGASKADGRVWESVENPGQNDDASSYLWSSRSDHEAVGVQRK